MVAYTQAVERIRDERAGLKTTHQGGSAFEVGPLVNLRRFLILGSEGGSFYVSQRELTAQNIAAVQQSLDLDPQAAIEMIVSVSTQALAPKNEPALLALALAASYTNERDTKGAERVRSMALAALPQVARTGTHLFTFVSYVDALRGWGSGLKRGISRWYTERSPMALANQVTKYRQRSINGSTWSHRDILRLAHTVPQNPTQDAIFKYVVDGEIEDLGRDATSYLSAVERVKNATTVEDVVFEIVRYGLPREVLPTWALNEADVWEALLHTMPMTAMIRNLGNMSKVGLLVSLSDAAKTVLSRLSDAQALREARIHPLDVLKAQMTYGAGRGLLGRGTWEPVSAVVSALEGAFYYSFGNVEPTNKNVLLALDVSSSMTYGDVGGVLGLHPRMASAAMAMVTARTEPNYEMIAFSHRMVDIDIHDNDSLETAIQKMARIPYGATLCHLPMQYAMDRRWNVDAFVIYTDNETGGSNPSQYLRQYRQRSGVHDSKLIVTAMTANRFSIAGPTDPNMLDVVGFDTSAPQVTSLFIRGLI